MYEYLKLIFKYVIFCNYFVIRWNILDWIFFFFVGGSYGGRMEGIVVGCIDGVSCFMGLLLSIVC